MWTWTRQRFQPKNPPYAGREPAEEFVAFGIGFIELPEGRVEARIAGDIAQELHIGMPMELTVIPFSTDEDGTEVLTYRLPARRGGLSHGRRRHHRGGAAPIRALPGPVGHRDGGQARHALALADAGMAWRDVQFAFGGSYEVDNPDAVVNRLGLTGCRSPTSTTGAPPRRARSTMAANTLRLGEYDVGVAIGMDKHLPGAFAADPVQYGCRAGTARPGCS